LTGDLSLNKRNAIFVRLGEKKILRGVLGNAEAIRSTLTGQTESTKDSANEGKGHKRKTSSDRPASKKSRK
jgi:AMMECR1 domain-containing protein